MRQYRLGGWDLTELACEPGGPEFEEQVKDVQGRVKKFQRIKAALDPKMSPRRFRGMLSELEDVYRRISAIGGFAALGYAADTQSDAATSLVTRMSKLGARASNEMLFFELWWKTGIDGANARRLMGESGDLKNYLLHKRLVAKYSLAESEERIINTLEVTGASALVKLYDKITNSFEYVMKPGAKKRMSREEIASHVRSGSARTRRDAYRSLLGKFHSNKGVLGEIYQNLVINWRDEGVDIRRYESPISIRNIGNDIDDKTVRSLLGVCRKNAGMFQRFFRLKAKNLGLKKLQRYDLYAPAAGAGKKDYRYDQSVRMVLDALRGFSPLLSGYAKTVFEQNHVDSAPRAGKRDGAFCSTLAPDITPYVLVNFTGKSRDVFTLAHELGHAVHSIAASKKSILVQDAPLPLAETASTFSELLLYDSISEGATQGQRRAMLSEKIDDFYATIMRQSYFTVFEAAAHDQIADTATVDEISGTYLGSLREQFGGSVKVTEDFGSEWLCIPHFYHTPFYCYAYSFGNLLALSLFQRYKKEGDGFVPAYMDILSAGGSKKPEVLLAEHGMDITSEGFWQDGFDHILGQIKNLSKMC